MLYKYKVCQQVRSQKKDGVKCRLNRNYQYETRRNTNWLILGKKYLNSYKKDCPKQVFTRSLPFYFCQILFIYLLGRITQFIIYGKGIYNYI